MKQTDAFPIPHRTKVVSFSLPVETADQIARLAARMGVSQSAMLAELLAEPIAAMASIIDLVPQVSPTAQAVKRAKGRSLEVIRDLVAQATAFLETNEEPAADASRTPTQTARPRRPRTPGRKQRPVRKRTSGRKR